MKSIPLVGTPLFAALLAAFGLLCGEVHGRESGPVDSDRESLDRAYREKDLEIVHQDLTFDLTDTHAIKVKAKVTVRSNRDGARLVAFGLGPVASLRADLANEGDRLLKTPGPLGHSSLVGVEFTGLLREKEKRAFTITYVYERGEWSPSQGLFVPLPVDGKFAYTAVFSVPAGEVAVCGPGRLVAHEDQGKKTVMKWEARKAFSPNMKVLERHLFHDTLRGKGFYLALGEASKKNAEAGLRLIAEVHFFLAELYGDLPHSQVLVYESDRESGTVMNRHGSIEMKKDEFLDVDDPWLAGALCHEIAHDWWGGILYGHPDDRQVIIEALAELSSIYYGEKKFGLKSAMDDVVINTLAYLEGDRSAIAETEDRLYSKMMLVYRHLMHVTGEKAFFRAARDILGEYPGKQVSHRMFFRAAEKASGKKLQWLLDRLYYTDADLDFALSIVRWEKKGERIVTTISLVERVGRFDYPLEVPVRIETAGGKIHDLACVIGRTGAEVTLETATPPRSIAVDPRWMLWDIDRSNNFFGKHAASSKAAAPGAGTTAEIIGGFRSRYSDTTWATLCLRQPGIAHFVSFSRRDLKKLPLLHWRENGKELVVEFEPEAGVSLCIVPGQGPPRVLPLIPGGDTASWFQERREEARANKLEEILSGLNSGDVDLVEKALDRLDAFQEADWEDPGVLNVAEPVFKLLKSPLPGRVRAKAFDALFCVACYHGDAIRPVLRKHMDALREALADRDHSVRSVAAYLHRSVPDKRSVEPLCRAILMDPVNVNSQAIYALENIGDPRAVPTLVKVLSHPGLWPRWNAANALARIPDRRAVEPLIRALGKEDPSRYTKSEKRGMGKDKDPARTATVKALREITGQDFGKDAEAWMKWWRTHGKGK